MVRSSGFAWAELGGSSRGKLKAQPKIDPGLTDAPVSPLMNNNIRINNEHFVALVVGIWTVGEYLVFVKYFPRYNHFNLK